MKTQCYMEGVKARGEKKKKNDCPYENGKLEAAQWQYGWNACHELVRPIEERAEKAIERIVRGLISGEFK